MTQSGAVPDQVTVRRRSLRFSLRSDHWNLEVRRPVLLCIEATAIDVASAPKQETIPQIDEIIFGEVGAFLKTEGNERLAEDALRASDGPWRISGRGDFVQDIREALRKWRHFVSFISHEIDLLRAGCNGMGAAPLHVALDEDPRQRCRPVCVGRVDDRQLEAVASNILEGAL